QAAVCAAARPDICHLCRARGAIGRIRSRALGAPFRQIPVMRLGNTRIGIPSVVPAVLLGASVHQRPTWLLRSPVCCSQRAAYLDLNCNWDRTSLDGLLRAAMACGVVAYL